MFATYFGKHKHARKADLSRTYKRRNLMARVVPVFKKGNRLTLSNYRPISMTSVSCKLLEHIVSNHITNHLEANNLLTPFQHGFRKGYSTITQLVSTVHDNAASLDKSGQNDVIFLDFSKAFDRAPHGKLLIKLQRLGIEPIVIKWIKSYLANRKQFVAMGDSVSSTLSVNSGVPQGSALGPLLFLIYINDIVNVVRLSADDCILYKEITSVHDQNILQQSLSSIVDWCEV